MRYDSSMCGEVGWALAVRLGMLRVRLSGGLAWVMVVARESLQTAMLVRRVLFGLLRGAKTLSLHSEFFSVL
jgi:hypothetical protein